MLLCLIAAEEGRCIARSLTDPSQTWKGFCSWHPGREGRSSGVTFELLSPLPGTGPAGAVLLQRGRENTAFTGVRQLTRLPSLTQMGGSLGLKHGKRLLSPLSQDDLDLLTSPGSKELQPLKSQKRSRLDSCHQEETQQRTEEALRELFRHVHNMPDSAKKKKLIRQVVWEGKISLGCVCQHSSGHRAKGKTHLRAAPSSWLAEEHGLWAFKRQNWMEAGEEVACQ